MKVSALSASFFFGQMSAYGLTYLTGRPATDMGLAVSFLSAAFFLAVLHAQRKTEPR